MTPTPRLQQLCRRTFVHQYSQRCVLKLFDNAWPVGKYENLWRFTKGIVITKVIYRLLGLLIENQNHLGLQFM